MRVLIMRLHFLTLIVYYLCKVVLIDNRKVYVGINQLTDTIRYTIIEIQILDYLIKKMILFTNQFN